jgi:hypothetical protein
MLTSTVDNLLKHGPKHSNYLHSLHDFENIGNIIQKKYRWINHIVLVAGSHRKLPNSTNSYEYIRRIAESYERLGFTVSLRLGHSPDSDIVYMSRAKMMVQLVDGNWSWLNRILAYQCGAIILDGSGDDATGHNFGDKNRNGNYPFAGVQLDSESSL